MYIKKIKLKNFRNYDEEEILLNEKTNIFFGNNAQGKTNILEAIYFCGIGKSFRTNKDFELIKENKEKAEIEIFFKKQEREEKIKIEIYDKKNIFINEIQIKKTSELIGKINVILFTPEDIEILRNEPQKRRKFLDIMISQLRPMYVHILIQYKKALEQRNNYLKQIKFENKTKNNLQIWNEQLAELGIKILKYRKEFIEKINKKIKYIHLKSTDNSEIIEIKYKTNIKNKEEYLKELEKNEETDIKKGFTTIGIHRDDFEVIINNKNVSVFGSQGQQRSSIVSLKLAEAEVVNDEIEEYPIILLDDFMSELDKKRITGFIKNIKNNQVIITTTDKIALDTKVYNYFYIENGKVKKE